MKIFPAIVLWAALFLSTDLMGTDPTAVASVNAPAGWRTLSPRDEIRPAFRFEPKGGRNGEGAFVIQHDHREGLDGYWTREFPVKGGQMYRFQVYRRTDGVVSPRRSALVRLLWHDARGRKVLHDIASIKNSSETSAGAGLRYVTNVLQGMSPVAEAEYPLDKGNDAAGWTEVSDEYQAPASATSVTVELHLQWAPDGKVIWTNPVLVESASAASRKVRLAAVHFRPTAGKTPAEKREAFAPFIEQAAGQHADLVVLPETLTYFGTGLSYAECAESIPGPSTEFFGQLAKKHDLYVVAGLLERDRHLIYNVAVLLGPDGKVAGKYRKVCLPRDEVAGGIAPGAEYPVFTTRFGKLGMMVCYDGFFPEVARRLSNAGAEVIAWPVWGCNPLLGAARACENHVYLVSSTYEDPSHQWIRTGIWDQDGRMLSQAEKWGTIVISEVDLNRRLHWPSLGDFKADLARHRPD